MPSQYDKLTTQEKTQFLCRIRLYLEILAKLAERLEVEPLLTELEMNEAVGWFIDPTRYRDTMANAELFGNLARAAKDFKVAAIRFLQDSNGRINPNELKFAGHAADMALEILDVIAPRPERAVQTVTETKGEPG